MPILDSTLRRARLPKPARGEKSTTHPTAPAIDGSRNGTIGMRSDARPSRASVRSLSHASDPPSMKAHSPEANTKMSVLTRVVPIPSSRRPSRTAPNPSDRRVVKTFVRILYKGMITSAAKLERYHESEIVDCTATLQCARPCDLRVRKDHWSPFKIEHESMQGIAGVWLVVATNPRRFRGCELARRQLRACCCRTRDCRAHRRTLM